MTDQQPHTPTKGDLKKAWDWYRADQDKQSGIEPNFRTYRLEFLRAWDAIEAADEQRGAIKALRDAAEHMDTLPDRLGDHWLKPHSVSEFLNYRADRIVNKEGGE